MLGRHGLDAEDAIFFVSTSDDYILVVLQELVVKGPGYLDRKVALDHRTRNRHQVAPVRGLVAERKGQYLGRDWTFFNMVSFLI